MTEDCFKLQSERLRIRWKNAFDPAFLDLLGKKMAGVTNEIFIEIVSFFIGSRPISKPPLLQDFQDARLTLEKRRFTNDVKGADKIIHGPGTVREALLRAGYTGCKSINEAVEIQTTKNRIAKALEEK